MQEEGQDLPKIVIKNHETMPAPSLAETVEQQQGKLTLREVRQFLEMGIGTLPHLEEGGKLHGSSEAENKKARIAYLKERLGLNPAEIPHPNNPEARLSERLVADVLIDTVTLCHTVNSLIQERNRLMAQDGSEQHLETIEQLNQSIQLQIDIHNAEMQLRTLKGEAMDHSIQIDGQPTTSREIGQQNGYFPARSLNLVREGYAGNIYQELETALKEKQTPSE